MSFLFSLNDSIEDTSHLEIESVKKLDYELS